jgi:acyl-CoA reductase-like NAD-dependent aldehyde dehydrogenase
VWTRDIKKVLRTAKQLRAGVVWVNDSQPAPTEAPWGGYKQSGIGRKLWTEQVREYRHEEPAERRARLVRETITRFASGGGTIVEIGPGASRWTAIWSNWPTG